MTKKSRNKLEKVKVACIPVFLIALSGCATIFSDSHDNITFNSVPEGAKVEVNGNSVGRTPVTVPIKRSLTPPQVTLKLDGYEQRTIMMQNGFNGVSLLNILFWPGFVVDAATGTLMKYDVVAYESELDPKSPAQQNKYSRAIHNNSLQADGPDGARPELE